MRKTTRARTLIGRIVRIWGVIAGASTSGCGPPDRTLYNIEARDIVAIRLIERERGPNGCDLWLTEKGQKEFDLLAEAAAPWQVSLRFREVKLGGAHGPYEESHGLSAICGFSAAEAKALVERMRAENPDIGFSKVVDTRPL